jgi:hypothetical protein
MMTHSCRSCAARDYSSRNARDDPEPPCDTPRLRADRLLCSGPHRIDAASQGCFLVFKFPGDVFLDEGNRFFANGGLDFPFALQEFPGIAFPVELSLYCPPVSLTDGALALFTPEVDHLI